MGELKFILIDSTLSDISCGMMQTHLYRMAETDCENGSEHVPPYLPFEMWLTIMSFVQVLFCSLEI